MAWATLPATTRAAQMKVKIQKRPLPHLLSGSVASIHAQTVPWLLPTLTRPGFQPPLPGFPPRLERSKAQESARKGGAPQPQPLPPSPLCGQLLREVSSRAGGCLLDPPTDCIGMGTPGSGWEDRGSLGTGPGHPGRRWRPSARHPALVRGRGPGQAGRRRRQG